MRPLMVMLLAIATLAGCAQGIAVPEDEPQTRRTAELFLERCSGCHSLDAADAHGSAGAANVGARERTNGPNFNVRHVDADDALYAIRNGGFSGAVMPANIVTGRQAEEMAKFLERYSGGQAGSDDVTESGEQTP